jgi:hypothetical protein
VALSLQTFVEMDEQPDPVKLASTQRAFPQLPFADLGRGLESASSRDRSLVRPIAEVYRQFAESELKTADQLLRTAPLRRPTPLGQSGRLVTEPRDREEALGISVRFL